MVDKANEKVVNVTDKSVTEGSDSALEDVFGVTGETEKKEETKVTVKKEEIEPEEQAERSRLGRRVKKLEDMLTDMGGKIDQLVSTPQRLTMQDSRNTFVEEDDFPEIISTREDFKKAYSAQKKNEEKERQNYETGYLRKLRELGGQNPDLHKEVVDEMMANFNVRYSDNPDLDAKLNYAEAKAALFSKRTAPTRPNVRGEKSQVSTNISVSTREEPSASAPLELDEHAKDFMRITGMKEDSAKEALKGETPMHLSSKR